MSSGHKWGRSEKCELCGDKEWMADPYCSKNPEVANEYAHWLDKVRAENGHTSEAAREGE